MKTLQRRKIFKLIIFSCVGFFFLSSLFASVISFQIYSQLKSLSQNMDSLQSQHISSLHTKVRLLDRSLNNPVFAVGASLLISPGSYSNLSSAVSSGNQILDITSKYFKENKSGNYSPASIAQPLNKAMPHINNVLKSISDLHLGGVASTFDRKLVKFRDKSQELLQVSQSVRPLISILPSLAGSEKPRKYLIAFQNSAEARGTGGILGAYAVLRADHGKLSITDFGSNSRLALFEEIPIQMPTEFIHIYNDDPAYFANSNISPHFPYGAKIWLALWDRQFGEKLDGVLTFDPIALRYLLEKTGPIRANGEVISSDNVVKVTLSEVYKKYETNNEARKQFLVEIIQAVSEQIEKGKTSQVSLGLSLVEPLNQHRLLIYSSHPAEQKIIETSTFSGAIQTSSNNQYRLLIQNTSGNKMDYYLERKLRLKSITCSPRKKTQVTFTLTNTAKSDLRLPSFVMGRLDLQLPNGLKNSYGTRAIILAPMGANIVEAKDLQTGKRFGFLVRERGHIGLGVQVDLAAGQSQTFTVTFSGGVGKLSSYEQPLVNPQKTYIDDRCDS